MMTLPASASGPDDLSTYASAPGVVHASFWLPASAGAPGGRVRNRAPQPEQVTKPAASGGDRTGV
jgi:hypothetical protein